MRSGLFWLAILAIFSLAMYQLFVFLWTQAWGMATQ
jgi:hypothetical protein